MAFFPSYRLMQEVRQVYEEEFSVDWVRSISQVPEMHEREREEFLKEFSKNEGTLVGFCVLGGVFSEGIDLSGEKLIGAFIVEPACRRSGAAGKSCGSIMTKEEKTDLIMPTAIRG